MKTLVAFTHMDWSFDEGQEVPDDHPMIAARPDLFDFPEPDPPAAPDHELRIRGPLVETPKPPKPPKSRKR